MNTWIAKRIGAVIVTGALVCPAVVAAQTYNVIRLDGLGGGAGANGVNQRGWIVGAANFDGDLVSHAALWTGPGEPIDLGSFGGPDINSAVAWPSKNNRGVIVGISDTAEDNPLGEAFSCWPFYAKGEPTRKICRGFRWVNGTMTALPPFPGGYNSYAAGVNSRGQIVGWAENGVRDPTCHDGFQVLQFRAAIWNPDGTMQELPPLPGDSTSAATAINDNGQVVGISGACGFAVGDISAAHAVIWENGVPTNIGDLGGHAWNTPTAINNDGVVVGFSLPRENDGTRFYKAFVWTKERGLKKLDEIEGDVRSAAFGVNAKGQIVGLSRTSGGAFRAVMWENADAPIKNLNDFFPDGPLYLVLAGDVNDDGVIVGAGYDPATNTSPAFALQPVVSTTGSKASSAERR